MVNPTEPWLAMSDRRVVLPCSSSPPLAGVDHSVRRAAPAAKRSAEAARRAAPGRTAPDLPATPPEKGPQAFGVVDGHAPTGPPAGLMALRWDVKPGHGLMRVLSFPSPSGWRDQMTAFIGRREFITLLGGAAALGR